MLPAVNMVNRNRWLTAQDVNSTRYKVILGVMLASVANGGPAINQSWLNVACLLIGHALPVFYLALSNIHAQRHVAFCERHIALHERHVAPSSVHLRHVALLIFRQWNASFTCCYVIFNTPIVTVKNTPVTDVARSHRSMTQYLITACVHNWRCLHTWLILSIPLIGEGGCLKRLAGCPACMRRCP